MTHTATVTSMCSGMSEAQQIRLSQTELQHSLLHDLDQCFAVGSHMATHEARTQHSVGTKCNLAHLLESGKQYLRCQATAVLQYFSMQHCRHEGQSRIPSWQLPQESKGPAVWQVEDTKELAEVVGLLLSEPLHRRSMGHAAVQGAAKIADSMMTIAWEVIKLCLHV